MAEEKWIQEAVKHPGRIKSALGVSEDEPIRGKKNLNKLRSMAEKKGSLGAAARLALRFKSGEFRNSD